MQVSEAVISRISCRGFRSDPVPGEVLRDILNGARQTPSGGNLQPWHVYAVAAEKLDSLVADVLVRCADQPHGEGSEYRIYPALLKEPYRSRRFKCGEDLYALLDIERGDKARRRVQFRENFRFFGAPLGLFIYIDRQMQPGQWADVGMFLQTVMLLARQHGLHTCPQEAWAMFHKTIATHLQPPPELMLFCGVAMGYMQTSHPLNALRTERAPLEEFCTFIGT